MNLRDDIYDCEISKSKLIPISINGGINLLLVSITRVALKNKMYV